VNDDGIQAHWHSPDMTNPKSSTYPYTLEVERNPKSKGAWQWAVRKRGAMFKQSDRALFSEAKARAQGAEAIKKLLQSAGEERR
jgi:hypothetical protein